MVGISTLVLLPAVRYELPSARTKNKTKHTSPDEENKEEKEGFINEDKYKDRTKGMYCNFNAL